MARKDIRPIVHIGKAGELCFTGLRLFCSNVQQLDGEAPSWMYRSRSKSHTEVNGSSGCCRLEVAWPVCGGLVGVQCVPVRHPLDQFVGF